MDIIKNYEDSVNVIVEEFKKKQEIEESEGYWIANQIGEVYDFGDTMTFDFHDVITDIKENAPKGEIFKWREYNLRVWNINNLCGGILLNEINYRNWLKGTPRLTDEELNTVDKKWKTLIDEIKELSNSTKKK